MRKNLIEVAPDKFAVVIISAVIIGFLFGLPVGFWVRSGIREEPIIIEPAQELPIEGSLTASLTSIRESLRNEALMKRPIEVLASWYGERDHGKTTASGKIFNMNEFTAAHRTLPFHSMVFVLDFKRHTWTTVEITDRGPAEWTGREIDLSLAAARQLGMEEDGIAPVYLFAVIKDK